MRSLSVIFLSLSFSSFAFADCNFETAQITGKQIPQSAKSELQKLLKASCNPTARISSTKRTSKRQTELMLGIYNRDGLAAAKEVYGAIGDKVLDYFNDHKAEGKAVQLAGGQKIIDDFIQANGASRTQLMHIEPLKNITFDIAPSSIINMTDLIAHLEQSSMTVRIIKPGVAEKALHVEFRK